MKLESKIIKLIEEFLKEELEETIELTIDSRFFHFILSFGRISWVPLILRN